MQPFAQTFLYLHNFSISRTLCNNIQIKNRSSQVVEDAEIDILEDLEQLSVKSTNDAYDDDEDAFTIIESKSGTKDNVIESFFNDPKKFTNKSPPRLQQSSAVESSSSSSFKKLNKLSQKERKKQQQQHSKPENFKKSRSKNSSNEMNQFHGFFILYFPFSLFKI